MSFLEFIKKFPTEEKVIEYFIDIRYPQGPICNHCKSKKVYQLKRNPRFFHCNDCNNSFSVYQGTIFEKTTTDLRAWMYAIHLFLNDKKGISALNLQREIEVTYKTAWRMLKQIRKATGNKKEIEQIEAIVEMDETYVGGKPRKKAKRDDDDDENKRGRGTRKTPVIGVLSRVNGKVHAKVALPNQKGKKITGKQLLAVLAEVCKRDSLVITDQFRAYNQLKTTDHVHVKVNHQYQYVNGHVHTNSIESFWALLKRGVYGTYHQISVKYLQSYVDEFCFRFNSREDGFAFDKLLKQAVLI